MVQLSPQECDELITAPGQFLEMQEVVIDGRKQRVWKNLPPTFRDFLIAHFDKYHSRPFINAPIPHGRPESGSKGKEREQVTFAQVLDRALGLAAELQRRGLGMGSRIGIAGSNSIGWVVAFVAIHLIGGIPVCFNTWLAPQALTHCLRKTSPSVILADGPRAALLRPLVSELQGDEIPVISWDEHPFHATPEEKLRIMSGTSLGGLGPESDGMIFFSSGTSGLPKAVLSTQRMALSNILSGLVAPARAALRAGLAIPPLPRSSDPQKTVLLAIPLFHVTGCLSWLMRAFWGGSKMVYMESWSAAEAVRLIAAERVTVIGGVPAVVSSILHHPSLPASQTFETVFYGGAPPSKQLAGRVKAKWPKAGLVQGYGLTETNAYMTSIAGQDYILRPESTGRCVPIASMRIVDPDTRRPLPTGETGLLMARGPQVMKCYYNDPVETAKTIDNEGWLDTGDVGYIDQEGFLYIKDRLKDIIIRGGENISTLDVENALLSHPSVAEAVAVGLDDERLGELVGAMVSLHQGKETSEAEILESARPILGKRALPVMLLISHDPLPRNVNGKVVKKDLKPIVNKAWQERQSCQPISISSVRAKL